jgi:hypothetical protein
MAGDRFKSRDDFIEFLHAASRLRAGEEAF